MTNSDKDLKPFSFAACSKSAFCSCDNLASNLAVCIAFDGVFSFFILPASVHKCTGKIRTLFSRYFTFSDKDSYVQGKTIITIEQFICFLCFDEKSSMNYLVVGASGIGGALADQLAIEHQVFATYFQHPKQDIANVHFHPLNVLDETLNLDFLPDTLDGLAYCVGAISLKPFARIHPDDFVKDFQLQVSGAIKVIQACLPRLKKSQHASIVLFSTVAVQTGFNFHSIVSASKGAIEGLTRALAAEFAPSIRVNCIAPSITATPLAGNIINTPEKVDANAQRHPLKKIGSPADVANVAKFLLSAESSWVTGQIIHVDGGIGNIKS